MVFSSPIFLFVFLPVFLLLYYAVRARNMTLLLCSLIFYAWGEPQYIFLMLFGILANWLIALGIEKRRSRGWLVLAVAVDLGMLAAFKYGDMLVGTINFLLPVKLPYAHLALPLGISFYTFQILSYVVDVWRGDVKAEKNPLTLGAYVSMFPQLIAGPIVRYREVADALNGRGAGESTPARLAVSQIGEGMLRFCVGLGKKVILANGVSQCADLAFSLGGEYLSAAAAWLGATCYAFQIYFDFSGYSDMAIGLGKMMGFRFPENFRYPYISASIQEFWRRWHLTLSGWFRDYLYIPLGGNRKGFLRTCINQLIVFGLCGLWHGASWSFLVWGLYHGLFLSLEKLPFLKRKLPRALGVPVTLALVWIGWVIFRADTMGQAWTYIQAMFGGGGAVTMGAIADGRTWAILAACAVGCTPWLKRVAALRDRSRGGRWLWDVAAVAVCAVILAVCVSLLAGGTYNPFIYFRF